MNSKTLALLDESFNVVVDIDVFTSLIWTDRYSSAGDFELVMPMNGELCDLIFDLQSYTHYLWLKDSEHIMIIEDILITSDEETGAELKLTGRSLESILDRRIIWSQTIISGYVQAAVQQVLNENIISPTIIDRTIPNFIFKASTDASILSMAMEVQFTGDNVYDAITSICDAFEIGFKITLNDDHQFVFELYSGTDRSYDQNANPYVVFSPNNDNLLNSSYLESITALKNVTLVAGEGEGSARRTATVGSGSGLSRRELFTDARDISSTTDEGTLTDAEYTSQLQNRGADKLAECMFINSFEGQIEPTRTYKYGTDFYLGDIVQIKNEYNIAGKVRVSEVVYSQNETGIDVYPTFISVA